MPEGTETEAPQVTEQTPPEGGQPKTFDAEYVEKLRKESAKYRTEAKANSEAAKRLAEIEEANKSEAQKLAEAKAAAERDRDAAKAEALRLRIATKHGISDEAADLFLTGTDEATLTKQAEGLAELAEGRKKHGNHVPREGTNPTSGDSTEREFTRVLFAAGD